MNLIDCSICFGTPRRLTTMSFWRQHLPFAMFLVHLLEPKTIVELGAHYGDSYCAFCQAVSELGLNTACYAIDTWAGDPHVGEYGPDVLAELKKHHDAAYGSFSTLVQSSFDEALLHFANGTIDILHIDGYHTYESVRHDFESWKPRLSSRGVTLFHDINVRERDFGVWKFWEEVKQHYPHFEFFHGHGLGVLAVGTEQNEKFKAWLNASNEHGVSMRAFFFALGERLDLLVKKATYEKEVQPFKDELTRKDQQLRCLLEDNARLKAFSDAVRQTWIYRLYKIFLSPFKSG